MGVRLGLFAFRFPFSAFYLLQLCPGAGVFYGIGYIGFMNLRLILALLAAGCFSSPLLWATAAPTDNPYAPIVTRNMFGLVPIPTNPPVDPATLIPPPKITPNGIMTIFGRLQVLFKVAGDAKPGSPAKDESYVLCEGDRQDDIEVQKIDEKAATITFNNHGVIQELPLVAASAAGGGGAAAAGPAGFGRPQGLPPLPGVAPAGGGTHLGFGGRFGRTQNNPPAGTPASGAPASSAAAPSGFGGATPATTSAPGQEPMTPETQIIMIEANRLLTQDSVNTGDMPPLPPTEMTPPDATGIGGAPLVQSSPVSTPGN